MRILVATDLHYRLPHYDWLVQRAGEVDVIALTGDLADITNPVPHTVQTVVLTRYLARLGEQSTVVVSSGNHDLDGPGAHGEQVAGWLGHGLPAGVHGDRSSVDVHGVRFTACPWWDGPVGRGEVEAQLAVAAAGRPAFWVWLYHSPPAGTVLCRDGRREFPDDFLAECVRRHQPELVLTGHIHQAPWAAGGSWHDRLGATVVLNPGKQIGPVPPHVTIDTDTGTAEWFGVFDTETITLG